MTARQARQTGLERGMLQVKMTDWLIPEEDMDEVHALLGQMTWYVYGQPRASEALAQLQSLLGATEAPEPVQGPQESLSEDDHLRRRVYTIMGEQFDLRHVQGEVDMDVTPEGQAFFGMGVEGEPVDRSLRDRIASLEEWAREQEQWVINQAKHHEYIRSLQDGLLRMVKRIDGLEAVLAQVKSQAGQGLLTHAQMLENIERGLSDQYDRLSALEDGVEDEPLGDDLAIPVAEMARRLHVSKSMLYGMMREGKVPTVKLGRRTLIPATFAQQFLAQHPE